MGAEDLTAGAEETTGATERLRAMEGAGLRMRDLAGAAMVPVELPAPGPGRSMGIRGRREDMRNRAGRAERGRERSAGTTAADRREDIRRGEAPASAAAEEHAAEEADRGAAVAVGGTR